jgi:DNA-binding CsgD family transcriptional regulator
MATVAQRWDEWLDLVSDLAAHPCPTFPRDQVGRQLAESFQTRVSWNWIDGDEFGFELDDPIPGWPTEEEYRVWATEGMLKHPILCFYRSTNLPVPMTVGRVPRELVPTDGFALLRDCLAPVGFEQQLSIPYRLTPASSRAFVFAQSGEDYSDEDLTLARLIQPLLALLARQADLLEGLGCPEAARNGLTGRELVVLRLLSEGRTAVSIAHALQVSPRTVHTHLAHIYRKLGVCDRMQAVLVATELGVLEPPLPPLVPS